MADDITFVGSTQIKEFREGGMLFRLGFKESDLDTLRGELDERGWVNVVLTKSKGKEKWYMKLDDYVPRGERESGAASPPPATAPAEADEDEMPF